MASIHEVLPVVDILHIKVLHIFDGNAGALIEHISDIVHIGSVELRDSLAGQGASLQELGVHVHHLAGIPAG